MIGRRMVAASTLAILAVSVAVASSSTGAGGSGNSTGSGVMPADAEPLGWSLQDMAEAVAYFSDSGNDPAFFPDTPFQVLYRPSPQDPHQGNTFHVKPGTYLYAKFFYIDDAPPVLGDFPADQAGAADYITDPHQLGGHDLEIEVDGKVTPLGGGNVSAPVDLIDAPEPGATHLIQIGAFIRPLGKGTHTVTIRGTFDGDAWDVIEPGFVFAPQITYTVVVE